MKKQTIPEKNEPTTFARHQRKKKKKKSTPKKGKKRKNAVHLFILLPHKWCMIHFRYIPQSDFTSHSNPKT